MAFPETQWTLIADATLAGDESGKQALRSLVSQYEGPVLGFIRMTVRDPERARDLAQSFWLHLIEKRTWKLADNSRGRFRTFLLSVLKNFIRDEEKKRLAEKRGGGEPTAELNEETLPDSTLDHSTHHFDREWAHLLLARSLADLEATYAKAGRAKLYETIRLFLPGSHESPSYEAAAAQANVSTDVIRVEIHRMRTRLKENLRRNIAQTVASPNQVDEEVSYLKSVLTNSPFA